MPTLINPPNMPPVTGVFSRGVLTDPGRLLFVSGHTGVDESGQLVGKGDVGAQTRQTLENIKRVVEATGGNLRDIVSVTIYLVDAKDYQAMNEVRREFFKDQPPASATVVVKDLVRPGALVEISAIAVVRRA